jgi:hypothetical protein
LTRLCFFKLNLLLVSATDGLTKIWINISFGYSIRHAHPHMACAPISFLRLFYEHLFYMACTPIMFHTEYEYVAVETFDYSIKLFRCFRQFLLYNDICWIAYQAVERVGRSTLKDDVVPDDLLILSCEEDYEVCVPFLEKGLNTCSLFWFISSRDP